MRLVGVEAAGAASLGTGRTAVLHGARSSVLADDDGQIADAHSISAGLDYPGVGPEHAALRDTGRAQYVPCTDEEALAAFHRLAETEGIIPALESSHALARTLDLDAELVVVCLSGRGDKDLAEVIAQPSHERGSSSSIWCASRRRPSSPRPRSKAAPTSSSSASRSPTRSPRGPTIQRASERALSRGMRTARCLEVIAETRARTDAPIIPMTYAAILEAYGYERFVTDSRAAGATSAIIVDLPVEEHHEVPRVQLVAPTSTDERIDLCAANTDGWLYLVSLTGTTGARAEVSPALAGLVERTRARTDLPLYAGFGISTPEHAAAVAELADGVVVGSRAVQIAEEGPAALRDYVGSPRHAIDAVAQAV